MFNNLLNQALKMIPSQTAVWRRYVGEDIDDAGYSIPMYEDSEITGSWQAVDTQEIQEMRLTTQKRYQRFYTSNDVKDINRGSHPDIILYNGVEHEVVGDADWYDQDGWKSILCVRRQDEEA